MVSKENKIIVLYHTLTGSNFKGEYEDTYTIELLFTLLNIDLIANSEEPSELGSDEMLLFAKEIIRIYETDDNEFSYYSIRNWVEAMFEYMKVEKKVYADIFKTNTYDLRNEISKYLKQGDE